MSITDRDQQELVRLLVDDLNATLGPGYEWIARANAERLRAFHSDDLPRYVLDVIESTQQDVHDEFIGTAWPQCPRHRRHPLWVHGGAWWCEQDRVLIARVGELGRSVSS